MTDWSADPWFAEHAWVAPRVGETRRSGFKSLRPHALSLESEKSDPISISERGGLNYRQRPTHLAVEGRTCSGKIRFRALIARAISRKDSDGGLSRQLLRPLC